jgi:hypothetical protein
MFFNINISLIFLCVVYNIINFDEEFLVMCTIIISFSQILNILFSNIIENYTNNINILKKLYKILINFYIIFLQNIFLVSILIEESLFILYNLYYNLQSNMLKFLIKLYYNKLYLIRLINVLLLNNIIKYNFLIEHYVIWYRLMYKLRILWIDNITK